MSNKKQTAFQKWFSTFNAEKSAPFASWTLYDEDGSFHLIDTDVVKEAVMNCSAAEQKQIKTTLVKIDFLNGDVNHFYKHLAQGLVNNF